MKTNLKAMMLAIGFSATLTALIPLQTHAVGKTASETQTVDITITPTLSLDVTSTVNIEYHAGVISTGTLSAKVKTNQQYAIQFSATQPSLVNADDSSSTIPANNNVVAGTNAWGIKKKQSASSTPLGSTTDVAGYTGLTTASEIFYRSLTGDLGTTAINFAIGISVDPTIAPGTYSTNVTVTASAI